MIFFSLIICDLAMYLAGWRIKCGITGGLNFRLWRNKRNRRLERFRHFTAKMLSLPPQNPEYDKNLPKAQACIWYSGCYIVLGNIVRGFLQRFRIAAVLCAISLQGTAQCSFLHVRGGGLPLDRLPLSVPKRTTCRLLAGLGCAVATVGRRGATAGEQWTNSM